MKKELVSIVVAVYQAEEYLRQCVDSILGQTYGNIEIILVDDGSTDQSPEICDYYASQDERVIVIHQDNKGLAATRNVGISESHGSYIAFIDCDDVISPLFVETLLKACIDNSADLAICDYIAVKEDFSILPRQNNTVCRVVDNADAVCRNASVNIRYIVVWNKLYHRSLFDDIRFVPGTFHDDEFVIWKILLKARCIVETNAILNYYRKRSDSIMGKRFSLGRLDKITALKEKTRFLEECGLEQAAIETQKTLYHILEYSIEQMKQWYPCHHERIAELVAQKEKMEKSMEMLLKPQQESPVSFLFPFHLIPKGTRLAIYGAGFLGQDYYRQASTIGWCQSLLLVDKYNITSSPAVQSIDRLFTEKYDLLLLAIRDRNIAPQVQKMLVSMGLPAEKIVWHAPEIESLDEAYRRPILLGRLSKIIESQKPRVFLMNTADHGNLGDHALSLAAIADLKERFPDREVAEVTGFQWNWFRDQILPLVKTNDPIFIVGGGYMGTLWENEDHRVKDIIDSFPQNDITMLPQTFYYDPDTPESVLDRERDFYSSHTNVRIIHRERRSCEWFTKHILADEGRNALQPDMVLLLHPELRQERVRRGVLLCFRADKESRLTEEFKERLQKFLEETHIPYDTIDTVADHFILPEDREKELSALLTQISNAELMITDRLHGMLFAKITETPCIAIDNVSGKVSGVYEWIKDTTYITCIEQEDVTKELLSVWLRAYF